MSDSFFVAGRRGRFLSAKPWRGLTAWAAAWGVLAAVCGPAGAADDEIPSPRPQKVIKISGRPRSILSGPRSHVYLAIESGAVEEWDLQTAGLVKRLVVQEDGVLMAAMSADGKWLATANAAQDRAYRLYDMQTMQVKKTLRGRSGVSEEDPFPAGMAFSPDSRTLAIGGETLVLLDVTTMQQRVVKPLIERSDKRLIDFNGRTIVVPRKKEHVGPRALAWSPDGSLLAASEGYWSLPGMGTIELYTWLRLMDGRTFQPARNLPQINGTLSMQFSPDGKMMAVDSGSGVILVDLAAGKAGLLGKGVRGHVVGFAGDGKSLILSGKSGAVRYDLDGTPLASFGFPQAWTVERWATTFNGRVLVAATFNAMAYWWLIRPSEQAAAREAEPARPEEPAKNQEPQAVPAPPRRPAPRGR